MNKLISGSIAALVLLTACGGSSSDRSTITKELIDSAKAEGLDLDETCASKVADKLSDTDATKLVASIESGDEPQLSEEGEALATELFACVSSDSLVEAMMDSIGDQPGIDQDCLRNVLEQIDPADLGTIAESGSADPSNPVFAQLMQDIVPCATGG